MRCAKPLLLVEDNPDDARTIQRAAEELGLTEKIIPMPSSQQALAYLRSPTQERPALILLDLSLSGESGTEFLQAVKNDPALAEIPIVVLTGSQDRRDVLASFDLHAAGYIVKPLEYVEAVEALKIIRDYWSLNHLPAGRA